MHLYNTETISKIYYILGVEPIVTVVTETGVVVTVVWPAGDAVDGWTEIKW